MPHSMDSVDTLKLAPRAGQPPIFLEGHETGWDRDIFSGIRDSNHSHPVQRIQMRWRGIHAFERITW